MYCVNIIFKLNTILYVLYKHNFKIKHNPICIMQTIFKLQKLKKNSTLEIRKIKLNLQIKQCK